MHDLTERNDLMRRAIAVAGLSVVGALFAHSTPAMACDPNRPPWCENACTIVPDLYQAAYRAAGGYEGPLPSWYQLNLGVCGS